MNSNKVKKVRSDVESNIKSNSVVVPMHEEPDLAEKYGRKLQIVQEPEIDDVIYTGKMKEYTIPLRHPLLRG